MHDVVIVGAGPAGNIAALNLAGLGYRVAVVDWRHDIGDKLCTGIIGAECADRFPPEEAHVYREARTATLVSPVGKRYRIVRSEPQAFIIDRVAYVGTLAQRAIDAGAEYELGFRVANIEVTHRGVSVLTVGDRVRRRFEGQIAIIASGFGSPLLRMVGLGNGGTPDYMVGSQAEVLVDGLEDTEVYLGEQVAPGSFGWLVPLSDSRALLGLMSHRKLNGHAGRFLANFELNGKVRDVLKEPRRWGIPLKPLDRTYRDRVLVVGDAAGLVKPTTGGGIYYALLSGEIAAETADEALIAGDFSAGRLRVYERRWRAVFGKELRIGYCFRMLYEALGDRQIERLLSHFLSWESQQQLLNARDFSFDWHSRVIRKAVHRGDLAPLIRCYGSALTPLLSRLVRAAFS